MATNSICYKCAADHDLRVCGRCKRPICQGCAFEWREWGAGIMHHTAATCRSCFYADLARDVAEGREMAGDVEPAPSFEEMGL